MISLLILAMDASAAGVPVRGPQPVVQAELSFSRTCADGTPRYALADVSKDLGPSLDITTEKSKIGYLYVLEAGYRPIMDADQPGAPIFLSDASTGNRLPFAVLDPKDIPPCRSGGGREYASPVRIRLEPSVRAELEIKPRTGIFRPACYKNVTTGAYKLDLWNILTLKLPDRKIEVKSADSESFQDEEECRRFYEAMKSP